MICPLLKASTLAYSGEDDFVDSACDCKEGDCAWWILYPNGTSVCAIAAIALHLNSIENAVGIVADK